MKLLGNRVLIKPIDKTVTSGGIFLPDNYKREPTQFGVVVSVGPGTLLEDQKTRVPSQLAEGDQVIIHYRHVGTEVEIGGVRYRILRETDVLAKVEDD